MQPITDDELARLIDLHGKTTGGEWKWHKETEHFRAGIEGVLCCANLGNIEFIALAHNTLPSLIARLRIAEARKTLDPLTMMQMKLMRFILKYRAETGGVSPTCEIMAQNQVVSRTTIHERLGVLRRKGWLMDRPQAANMARNVVDPCGGGGIGIIMT